VVSVPEPEEEARETKPKGAEGEVPSTASTQHTEIQYHLLKLGSEMGLDVWVARNDRTKIWNGEILGSVSRVVSELPTQFNEATNRTIELIDVLWLRGNSIVAAFEIECTTAVYSGLLRMSDLLALQPNLDIRLYLVAPETARQGRGRNSCVRLSPLASVLFPRFCGFLPFSVLKERLRALRSWGSPHR